MTTERTKIEIVEDFRKEFPGVDLPEYTHVKVLAEDGFDVLEYFKAKFDETKPHMVVRHREGKQLSEHFHVQGILLKEVGKPGDVHAEYEHPAKRRRKKPFQMKREHFKSADALGFLYVLKPPEWTIGRAIEDIVLTWYFNEEAIQKMRKLSEELFELKKRKVTTVLGNVKRFESDTPEEFHTKCTIAVMESLSQESKAFHAGIKNQVLKYQFEHHTGDRRYIAGRYM